MQSIGFGSEKEMPITAISMADMSWNKTGTWRYLRPRFVDRTPPCNTGCPAGEDIEGVMVLVHQERYGEALDRILEENPFPATCGRVCYHPCEMSCNRGEFDEPIAIHAIERFVADKGYRIGHRGNARIKKDRQDRVAVIGSGPAGLTCAYHLARLGYPVTVFEKLPLLGGMLRIGIPHYRLPKEVLDQEIDYILNEGIDVEAGVEVGKDVSLNDLKEFRAIFLACGAHMSQKLDIRGKGSKGIESGLGFLKKINLEGPKPLKGRVVIVGGGNTAIDCARSALRCGAKPIILYRRTKEEMPAIDEEVTQAENEGVEIEYLVSPIRMRLGDKKEHILECVRNRLGPPDKDGRRRPVPIEGSNFSIGFDKVISAVGESTDLSFLPQGINIEDQLILTDATYLTSLKGFYAGGDVTSRLRMVVHAIGAGKKAAVAIDCDFRGEDAMGVLENIRLGSREAISMASYRKGLDVNKEMESKKVVHLEDLNTDHFEKEEKITLPSLSLSERIQGFDEVNLGLSEDLAKREAERCFNCAVCNKCGNCFLFCPDVAVILEEGDDPNQIDYDHCKGCGICVEECPRAAMLMEEEMR